MDPSASAQQAPPQAAPGEPSVPYDQHVDLRLRRLARRLVTDVGRADDVVQDVWCAAIGAPPPRAPEQWLRALTRRFASRSNRDLARRAHLERDVARPEAVEEHEHTLRDHDAEDALLEALGMIRGRRADVLRLRYSEGHKLREIAERLGVPLGTIKADHALALRELKKRLDQRLGSERRWALALVPLAARSGGAAPLAGVGASLGGALAGLAAAALVFAALGRAPGGCAGAPASAADRAHGGPIPGPEAAAWTPIGASLPLGPAPPSAASRVAGAEAAAPEVAAPERLHIEVALTGGDGAPLTGGMLAVLGQESRQVGVVPLDGAGVARFALEPGLLAAPRRAGGAPVFGITVRGVPRAVPHVYFFEHAPGVRRTIDLATPELRLHGRVATADGVPIAGAVVLTDSATFLIEELAPDTWRQRRIERSPTDAAGGFVATRLEPGERSLMVTAPGYQTRHVDVVYDTAGEFTLPETIVLAPAASVAGVVVDAAGLPVTDAEVWLEHGDDRMEREVARTDRSGSFRLDSAPPGPHVVWARAPSLDGGPPRTAQRALDVALGGSNEARLELTGRPLGRLRLVDDTGARLAGWMLHVVPAGVRADKRAFAETVTTDAAGEALVERDPGETVRVMCLDLGLERRKAQLPVHSELVTAAWDGVREVVVARAHEARSALVGRLLETDGTPYRRELLLYAPDHDHSLLVAVKPDGSFRLDGVPSGRYELMGQRDSGAGFAFNIHHLAPGDTIDFGELRLPPAEVVGVQARRPATGPDAAPGGACAEGPPRLLRPHRSEQGS